MIDIYSQEEYDLVIKLRSWSVKVDLLAMEFWNPKIPKSKVDLTKPLLWLRIYNMKSYFDNPPTKKSTATAVGEVKDLDPRDCIVQKRKVQKAQVIIDVRDRLRMVF